MVLRRLDRREGQDERQQFITGADLQATGNGHLEWPLHDT
jgi:hypothetical protein